MHSSIAASCNRWNDDINYGDQDAEAKGAELLAAAREGRGNQVVQILETDPDLLRVGDPVGDTTLHVLARAGHVDALQQLIEFLEDKHKELLTTVAMQGNGHGDTPLHVTVTNGHKKAAVLLFEAESMAASVRNEDGKSSWDLTSDAGYINFFYNEEDLIEEEGYYELEQRKIPGLDQDFELVLEVLDDEDNTLDKQTEDEEDHKLVNRFEQLLAHIHCNKLQDKAVLELLEANPKLIQHKNKMGNTVLHEAASSGNTNMLTKLIKLLKTSCNDNYQVQIPRYELLLEGNNRGDTALHLAILKRHKTTTRYLMEVEPEAAFKVNKEGKSPMYVALQLGQYELMTYVLQVMPEASISLPTRMALLTPNTASISHAAIKART